MDKEISNLLTKAMQDHEKAEAIEDAYNKIKQGAYEIVLNSKGGEPFRNIDLHKVLPPDTYKVLELETLKILNAARTEYEFRLKSVLNLEPKAAVSPKKGTPRKINTEELEAAVGEGLTVLEIAKKLCVAEQTVRNAMCRYRITMPERPRKNAKIPEIPIKPKAEVAPVQQKYKPVRQAPEKIILTDAERKMLLSGQQICPQCRKKFVPTNEWVYKDKHGRKVCSYKCAQESKREGLHDKEKAGGVQAAHKKD